MHAIDKDNVQYDSKGTLNETGIEIANLPRFKEGLECLSNTNFINDRLADIGGLNLAYSAYLESNKNSSKDVSSENSNRNQGARNFTNLPLQQVFFLNLAQSFCTDGFPNVDGQDDETWRLEQMLISSAPFDRAFECPAKDRQCELW
ncbi:hypothetical protein M5D96_005453 [Drosophila gunungcola]|uniref:Peptidase M13 C-terminal domain-containing protein n=1 Tax=Drosophila gunungcola TaxID=103775 RepID=A0A9P9YQC2_9MUSC|nr:hypothetical protein M5D96_005453 [Drosophila gunungcola]